MNKLEVADLIEQIPQELTPDDFLVALATKAEEAEREACAKVCDGIRYSGYCPPEDGSAPDYYNEATQECAEAIRARGEK